MGNARLPQISVPELDSAQLVNAPIFANGAATAAFGYLFRSGAKAIVDAREAGTLYATGHRIEGAGPYHLALEYVDKSGPHWISAGPLDGLLVSGQDGQRPTDSPSLNVTISVISPPCRWRSGGVNIYPQECENLLITHPKVADAAVFGVPHRVTARSGRPAPYAFRVPYRGSVNPSPSGDG